MMSTETAKHTLALCLIALAISMWVSCGSGSGVFNPNNFGGGTNNTGSSGGNRPPSVNSNNNDNSNGGTGGNDNGGDGTGGNGMGNQNDNSGGDGGGNTSPLGVRLIASNTMPQFTETVVLRCELINGSTGSTVLFNFIPDDRLEVNQLAGLANLTILDSDLGRSFSFTCQANDDRDLGPASNTVIITPVVP